MDTAASAAALPSPEVKQYAVAFARTVLRFLSVGRPEEVLAQVPALLVSELGAARAELWLWDEPSSSAYLAHAAGVQAPQGGDFATAGRVGAVAQSHRAIESAALADLGPAFTGFCQLGLSHISVYPLLASGRLLGILTSYTAALPGELSPWWRMYAEISSGAVQQALAAKESQKTISQFAVLVYGARLLNSTLDLSELMELILRLARTEVKAERGAVFLVDKQRHELWSVVSSGQDRQEIRVQFGGGVPGRVAVSGETINVPDAYSLDYFDRSLDQRLGFKTKSLLCLPIRHHTGEIVGVIQLVNKQTGGRFTAEDEDFLVKLSAHMATALENARLHRAALQKHRAERELEMARAIQRRLLPEPPVVPGYDLAVLNEPCYECGGDYYDFLNLGPQTLLLVVADVQGKGIGSALVMSNLQAMLRALVMHLHSLEVLTISLNELMHTASDAKYLSIFLGLVDTRRSGLHYINAGHVPPILISGDSGDYKQLREGGTVIGMFPEAEYARGSAKLRPGDLLVLCTDGILEANNSRDEAYGTERLAACVSRHRHKPAQAIVEAVLADVHAFAVGGSNIDDKVLMVLKMTKD